MPGRDVVKKISIETGDSARNIETIADANTDLARSYNELAAAKQRYDSIQQRTFGNTRSAPQNAVPYEQIAATARMEAVRGVAGPGMQSLQYYTEEYIGNLKERTGGKAQRQQQSRQMREFLAGEGDHDSAGEIAQEALQDRLKATRQNFRLQRMIASRVRRNVDPNGDPLIREEVSQAYGLSDKAEVDQKIGGIQAQAKASGLLQRRRSLLQNLAVAGMGAEAIQLSRSIASSAGSGEAFNADQNMSSILGLVGGFTGGATGFAIGSGIGAISDAYFSGQRQFNRQILTQQSRTAFTGTTLRAAVTRLARENDPTTGVDAYGAPSFRGVRDAFFRQIGDTLGIKSLSETGLLGEKGAVNVLGAAEPLRQIGLNDQQLEHLAGKFGKRLGEDAAISGFEGVAAFTRDPFVAARMRGYRTEAGLKEYFGTPSNIDSGVRNQGLDATLKAINSLPYSEDFKQKLNERAITRSQKVADLSLTSDLAGVSTGIAQNAMSRLQYSGGRIDSPGMKQAEETILKRYQEQARAIEQQITDLKAQGPVTKENQRQLAEWNTQLAGISTATAQLKQGYAIAVAERRTGRIEAGGTLAALRMDREQFALEPGQSAPSLKSFIASRRAALAEANRQANDSTLPEEMREAARVRASQAETAILTAQRGDVVSRALSPAAHSQAFTTRFSTKSEQQIGFGVGLDRAKNLLDTDIANRERTLQKERDALTLLETTRQKNPQLVSVQMLDEQRGRVTQTETELESRRRMRAYADTDTARDTLSRRATLTGMEASYTRSQRLGSRADHRTFQAEALSLFQQARNEEDAAAEARRRGETGEGSTEAKALDRAQAFRLEARAKVFEGNSYWQPSARSSLRMGEIDTRIQLAQMNPFGMGTPPSLYRQKIGELGANIGDLQSKMSGLSDAEKANLQPQLNAMRLERASAFNALRTGEMGRIFSLSYGAPSGFSFYGEALGPGQEYGQRTGTPVPRMLGGGPERPGLFSPSDGGGMGGPASPIGTGGDPEIKALLREIRDELKVTGSGGMAPRITPASGPALRQNEANDPTEAARRAAGFKKGPR